MDWYVLGKIYSGTIFCVLLDNIVLTIDLIEIRNI